MAMVTSRSDFVLFYRHGKLVKSPGGYTGRYVKSSKKEVLWAGFQGRRHLCAETFFHRERLVRIVYLRYRAARELPLFEGLAAYLDAVAQCLLRLARNKSAGGELFLAYEGPDRQQLQVASWPGGNDV